jgi:hypothetical protein
MAITPETTIKAHFELERETKGAGRYNEIDATGATLKPFDAAAMIGTLYIRKNAFRGRRLPSRLEVSVMDISAARFTGGKEAA